MNTTESHKEPRAEESREPKAAEQSQGPVCRCKEVSRKKLPDLIRMALEDLAFWKKKSK